MRTFFGALAKEYVVFGRDVISYVRAFGLMGMFTSPYAHLALLGTLVCRGIWSASDWYATPLAVLPALLGFTLAAYALLLGFGDEKFRSFLADRDPGESADHADPVEKNLLVRVSAIFLHFVIVEVVGLAMAVAGFSHPLGAWHIELPHESIIRSIFAFVGVFFFVFSITSALATGFNIFHATKWYVNFKANPESNDSSAQDTGKSA